MKYLVVVGFSLITLIGFAQIDRSSSVLIKGSDQAPQESLQNSERFQVKKAEPLVVEIEKPVLKKRVYRKISSEKKEKPPESTSVFETEPQTELTKEPHKEPTVVEQVKDLVLGNPQPSIENYKEQVHPDDVRLNRIEINISPGFIYVDSKSNYSFKNYTSASPYAQIGAQIWLTPMIGIYGKYGQSTGADVVEGSNVQEKILVTYENIDLGFDFRKFFGLSRRSNSATFGVHYLENKFIVPSDNNKRVKSKSNGLGVHFSSRFPIAPSYAWVLGAKIEPKVSHIEYDTALSLQSGTGVESSRVGFNFGGEFKLSRQHQMIWDINLVTEKNQFTGVASKIDPETGITPSGVSVSNNQVLFTFGYRWGQ